MGNTILKKCRGKVDDPEKMFVNPVNRVLSINEIVSKILTHVYNINRTELMKCRLVCKNWKSNVFLVLIRNQVQFKYDSTDSRICMSSMHFEFNNNIRKHLSPTCELPLAISGNGYWPSDIHRLFKLLDIYAHNVSRVSIKVVKGPRKLLHPKLKHPVLPNQQSIEQGSSVGIKQYTRDASYFFSLVTDVIYPVDDADDLQYLWFLTYNAALLNGIPFFITHVELRLDTPDQLQQALGMDDISNIKGLHIRPDTNTRDFRVVFNCPKFAECINIFIEKRTVSLSISDVSCRVGVSPEAIFKCRNVFLNMQNLYIQDPNVNCKFRFNFPALEMENIRSAQLHIIMQAGIFRNVEKLDVKLDRYDENDNISEQNLVRKLLVCFRNLKTLSYNSFKHCPLLGLLNLFTQMHNLQLLDIEVEKECLECLQSDGVNLEEFGPSSALTKLEVLKIRNISFSALPVYFPERIYNDLFTKMSKLRSVFLTGQIVVKKED